MLYIGLDVHAKWTTMVGFDPHTGEVVKLERIPNEGEAMRAAVGTLAGPLHGVMEAGTNSWAMYRELRPLFHGLTVADPAKLWNRRTDRGAKTDRRDALRMAEMLYRGEIKGIYVPDERTQDLRVLVRGKVKASRWVTKLTNEIGSLLRSWGYVGERSLLTKRGRANLDQAQLPKHSARMLSVAGDAGEGAADRAGTGGCRRRGGLGRSDLPAVADDAIGRPLHRPADAGRDRRCGALQRFGEIGVLHRSGAAGVSERRALLLRETGAVGQPVAALWAGAVRPADCSSPSGHHVPSALLAYLPARTSELGQDGGGPQGRRADLPPAEPRGAVAGHHQGGAHHCCGLIAHGKRSEPYLAWGTPPLASSRLDGSISNWEAPHPRG